MQAWLRYRTIFFILLVLVPLVLVVYEDRIFRQKTGRRFKWGMLFCYFLVILNYTIFGREGASKGVILTPFWTYAHLRDFQYRWEIIMNVMLFVPLGFLYSYAAHRNQGWGILLGLLLSVAIEYCQYCWALGLCETDDAIHNTLGTAIGCGYWRLLVGINNRFGSAIRSATEKICSKLLRKRNS